MTSHDTSTGLLGAFWASNIGVVNGVEWLGGNSQQVTGDSGLI